MTNKYVFSAALFGAFLAMIAGCQTGPAPANSQTALVATVTLAFET